MNDRITLALAVVRGGVLGAALLGLGEAAYHLVAQGAPDLVAPFYGLVLYGAIGGALAAGAAVVVAGLGERLPGAAPTDRRALAHVVGHVVAVAPMAGFVMHYLGNKVVFAEQGVPLVGKLAIAGILLIYAALAVVVGRVLLRGPLAVLDRAAGFGGLLGTLGLALGGVAVVGSPTKPDFAHHRPAPPGLAEAPDVLLFTVDTLRADHLGVYGGPEGISPALDALAADGIVFEDASAHASWTRSSFASLWTSRIPSAHKADRKASRLSDDLVLLSEVLQANGVTTGNLANNINVTATFNFDQGYDTFLYEAPDYHFGATESVFSLTFYKVVHKLREKLGGSKVVESFYQPAEVVLDDARAFIEANAEARWMLGVHLMEPHDPYFEHPYLDGTGTAELNGVGFARAEVEKPSLDQADYLRRVYADEVRHLDRKLAPFLDWLKKTGRYDRTLIVVTADHGEEFGEHGGFWHGTTLYEEQTHVPLVIKLPQQELAGRRVAWQARLIDVAPTITAALGLEPDPTWAGRELLTDVRKEVEVEEARAKALEEARDTVAALAEAGDAGALEGEQRTALLQAQRLLEAPEPTACDTDYDRARDRLVVSEQDFEGNVLAAVRHRGFKLIEANADNPRGLPERQLFDLVRDGAERTDLVGAAAAACDQQPATLLAELHDTLAQAREQAATGAVEAADVEVDDAETCNLCALGYLDGPQCEGC